VPEPALPDLDDVRRAAERIAPHARRTPVLTSSTLDRMCGARLFFKCEGFQKGGAFKFRGAANTVLSLSEAEAARGVVTHSSGNHGAALALAAAVRGVPARVVMPRDAPRVKREAVAGYGAVVVPCEPTAADREAVCARLVAETGGVLVHPYDDPRVIAGQGTAALELLAEVPALDLVVVPVGGGGLASGTGIAVAGASPSTRVVGAEPAAADDAARSLAAGRLLANPPGPVATVADGLKASLAPRTFAGLSQHLAAVVTVGEDEIVAAMRLVWERMKIVIEPSAAVPVAALLSGAALGPLAADGAARGAWPRVGVVLSGANVDLDRLPWLPQAGVGAGPGR
jgi:threonine dehydratase